MSLAFNNDRFIHGQAKELAVPDIVHAINIVSSEQGIIRNGCRNPRLASSLIWNFSIVTDSKSTKKGLRHIA
jgi:hypothetical protein